MSAKWLVGTAVFLMVLAFAIAGVVTFGLTGSAAMSNSAGSGRGAPSHLVEATVTTISLTPTDGAVVSSVSAMGSGFSDTSAISFLFGGVPVGGPCTSDGSGDFTCTFNVPYAPAGPFSVVATDASLLSANAIFTVTPSLSLSASSDV
jgi:hypothetical protein